MKKIEKIYVSLLGEDIDVWRPVDAEMVSGGYRILGVMPEGERWQFEPDEVVMCTPADISGEVHLVASRRVNIERAVYLYFCDFKEHIDLSFLKNSDLKVWKVNKGDPTPNGARKMPYNVTKISYTGTDLDDEYNVRIDQLIEAIGGDPIVKDLVDRYQARISAITLGIPTRTGDTLEDSFITKEMMAKLCGLNLDIHFYYT